MKNLSKTTKSKRDYTKYVFKGNKYGKSRLVLAVISDYLTKHPNLSLTDLKTLFSREKLNQSFEVVELANNAAEKRFFLNDDDIIKYSKKKLAITNQWGKSNIQSFIDFSKKVLHLEIHKNLKQAA